MHHKALWPLVKRSNKRFRGYPAATVAFYGPDDRRETITRHAIDEALRACDHDVARAARRLGVHRSTVYRHLARQRPPAGNTKD